MKKSFVLIKALIIVLWSAQVSLANTPVSASLAEKVYKYGEYRTLSGGHTGIYYYRDEFYTCNSFTEEGVYDITDGLIIRCEFVPVVFSQ